MKENVIQKLYKNDFPNIISLIKNDILLYKQKLNTQQNHSC